MNIIVLTPIYAATTSLQGATPVVHYFTREWVKSGHNVTVFNFVAKYPRPFYWFSRLFQHKLNSYLGMLVPIDYPTDDDYQIEGVSVHRRCLKKFKPHALYSPKEKIYALECVEKECLTKGVPDWFVGHWDNPQLELLTALKKRFNKPIALVFHSNFFDFEKKYGDAGLEMVTNLDAIGFRSHVGQRNFEAKYGKPKRSFIASSGVSETFLLEGEQSPRIVTQPVHNFVFVGSLIARKHPAAIVEALSKVYPDGTYSITFIGDGAERTQIEEKYQQLGCKGELHFTGRIPREEIIQYLRQSDVFIMISSGEIFGLVYLEAMALGVIPVGSKNEGIDGIICDGDNGFLCEAGNVEELAAVINKIKNMTTEQLTEMSSKARGTAIDYSDKCMAELYLKALES